MTQDELDALPECGGIGSVLVGNVRIPFARESFALYQPPDEPMMVIDLHGISWMLGYANGKRWKRRMGHMLSL